jgi:hypothetical protein
MAQSDFTAAHGVPATEAPWLVSGLMALGDRLHAAFVSLRYAPQEERSLMSAPKQIDAGYLRDIDMSVGF